METAPGALDLMLKALLATMAGLGVGYERQRKGKPVGMLTAVVVALGSMLYVQAGVMLGPHDQPGTDQTRLASLVITGIGFVGAGAIMRSRYSVTGLASAAAIWALGAIGIMIAWGLLVPSLLMVALLVMLLRLVPDMEHRLFHQRHCVHADVVVHADAVGRLLDHLKEHEVSLADAHLSGEGPQRTLTINECGLESKAQVLEGLRDVRGVEAVSDKRDLFA